MDLKVLDGFPELVSGMGSHPAEGGCIMQVTSWLWNGSWGDHPECVDPRLISVAIAVNDMVLDSARNRLLHAVPSLMNTKWLPEGLSGHENYAVYERISEWVDEHWPFDAVRVTECECPEPKCPDSPKWSDRIQWGHDDLFCLIHRIESAITRAGDFADAMGGGFYRWECDNPHGSPDACPIPDAQPMLRFSGQEPRHNHWKDVPVREEGSTELADFLVAFTREWVDAFEEYAPKGDEHLSCLLPARWEELKAEMQNA